MIPADTVLCLLVLAFACGLVAAAVVTPTREESESRRRRLAEWIEQNRIDS